jgi:maltose O-acetyltransferase
MTAGDWIDRFNGQGLSDEERHSLMVERFASVGDHAVIRPPFFCDYGYNISLGAGAFLNFNCIILDVEPVSIGEGTAIGPAVQILASDHPRDHGLRKQRVRFGRPVTIGANVWIGGGAIILPGITIGEDAIVSAGSIVTRDVAAGVTVVGNPARER